DTNYHYVVPALAHDQKFALSSTKVIDEFLEAKALGIHTRPVLVGPVSYLLLSKGTSTAAGSFDPLALLPALLPVYLEVLQRLSEAGADWVQIDEPCLVLDQSPEVLQAYVSAYREMAGAARGLKLLLATYFGAIGDNLATVMQLPVAGLHLDLV